MKYSFSFLIPASTSCFRYKKSVYIILEVESDSMTFVLTHCDPWRETGGGSNREEES